MQTGGYTRVHSTAVTVNYVSTLAFHYEMFGEIPPDDSKMILKLTCQQHFQMISYAQYKAMGGVLLTAVESPPTRSFPEAPN